MAGHDRPLRPSHGMVMTAAELASRVGTSPRRVRYWINHCGLPVYPDGRVSWLLYREWEQRGGAWGYRRRCTRDGVPPGRVVVEI